MWKPGPLIPLSRDLIKGFSDGNMLYTLWTIKSREGAKLQSIPMIRHLGLALLVAKHRQPNYVHVVVYIYCPEDSRGTRPWNKLRIELLQIDLALMNLISIRGFQERSPSDHSSLVTWDIID